METIREIEETTERMESFDEEHWIQLRDAKMRAYLAMREDLETPHNCTAELFSLDVGAPLDELDVYAEEFHKLVEEMFEALPDETRILEGTEIPTYDQLRQDVETENGLSETNEKDDNGECAGGMAS